MVSLVCLNSSALHVVALPVVGVDGGGLIHHVSQASPCFQLASAFCPGSFTCAFNFQRQLKLFNLNVLSYMTHDWMAVLGAGVVGGMQLQQVWSSVLYGQEASHVAVRLAHPAPCAVKAAVAR